jgi:probable rRNA maturation factor
MQITIVDAQREIRFSKRSLERLARKVLLALKAASDVSLTITFVDRAGIRRINRRYFKKKSATDVIALEYRPRPGRRGIASGCIGDVVICPRVASANAKIYGNSLMKELTLYMIHGVLHLMGYDDTSALKRSRMRKKENEILEKLWWSGRRG